MAGRHLPLPERFEQKIERVKDGCWLWRAARNANGYGLIRSGPRGSKQLRAHRLSYALHKGPVPDDVLVLHACDNPSCVNPEHLFLGDTTSNIADKVAKGRQARGEKHGMSKLSSTDVSDIRSSHLKGVELARKYGVCPQRISAIRLRHEWKHIT